MAVQTLTRIGSAAAVASAALTAWNARRLRVPPADPPPVAEPVAVLLPLRDEAHRVEPCLRSLLAQTGVRDLRILVLDDGSTDATVEVVRRVAGPDERVTLLSGAELPDGWWGKPWACHQLAAAAFGAAVGDDVRVDRPSGPGEADAPPGVLVFVDADVVLAPRAVAASVALLRWSGLDLVSPYPRQIAVTGAERLMQPLLLWSILSTLPLRLAERSPRPSLAAANGQLLVIDADAYTRAGGHAAVRDAMLEDVELLREVKRTGGRGTVVDGTELASCRMYDGWPALRDGYAKSLWSAFGSPGDTAAVLGVLGVMYVLPPLAALRGSRAGLVGYAAAVAGRALAARRTGSRVWPDPLLHPLSVGVFGWLTANSLRRHRAGTLAVRGRPIRHVSRDALVRPRQV